MIELVTYVTTLVLRGHFKQGSKVQWNWSILLDKSHKLDPQPLNEGPRPKNGKSRLNLHGTILEGRSIGFMNKKKVQKESSWFEKRNAS
jgi:hypothetical protein